MVLQEWCRESIVATVTLYAFEIGFITVVNVLFFPEFFHILKFYHFKKKATTNSTHDKITLHCNLLLLNKEGDKYLACTLYF